MAGPAVTIIIPTLGLRERAASLQAAIESALTQAGVCPTVIVVLNGQRRCADVEDALRNDSRVTLVNREAPGIPDALIEGRTRIETPWFTALDDDDLLLPGALLLRIRALEQRSDCAAVVTNGYKRHGARDDLHIPANQDVNADPIRSMLERNWCLPGSWLCRTSLVGVSTFQGMPSHLECTYLALRIASEHPIIWVDTPTVVYTVGSPEAESLSRAFLLGQVHALRCILTLRLPSDVRRAFRERIASAYHVAADFERNSGDAGRAWRLHAASLLHPSGWRYVPFTRHLLRDALRMGS